MPAKNVVAADVYETEVSESGRTAIFTFKGPNGPIGLSIPSEQLPHLLLLVAEASGIAERNQKQLRVTPRYVLETAKWRAFTHPDGEHIVQEFHLPQGMVIQLRTPKALIPNMVGEFQALHAAPQPSKTKN